MLPFFNKNKPTTSVVSVECKKRFDAQVEFLGLDTPIHAVEPVVSVLVATYQHSLYIAQCLEGILMQKTTFAFEIIVGEDQSNDGTREICVAYAEKYPDKIRLFLRDRKTSHYYDKNGKFVCRFNGTWNRMSARGKYLAICEGDDYWIDCMKLQKQFEFMEKNPSYSLCFHNTIDKSVNGEQPKYNFLTKTDFYVSDLLQMNYPRTCSEFIRKSCLKYTDIEPNEIFDWTMNLLLVTRGPAKYVNETMSVYRIHSGGEWNGAHSEHVKYTYTLRFYAFAYHIISNKDEKRYAKRRYNRVLISKSFWLFRKRKFFSLFGIVFKFKFF